MSGTYTPSHWYWLIGSEIWSSAANAVVSSADASYLSWVAEGNAATVIPTVGGAMGAVIIDTGLLDDSDTTMLRVAEAVALGLTTFTAADVVAWVNWRRALRAIVSGSDTSSTSIPAKPAYPSGT